jgi:hypothetical protein
MPPPRLGGGEPNTPVAAARKPIDFSDERWQDGQPWSPGILGAMRSYEVGAAAATIRTDFQ